MKILITGGSGFIGSSLAESLRKKHQIFAPNSRELNLIESSSVLSYLKSNKFDFIVHAANHHVHPLIKPDKEPSLQLENNLKMFFNIASHPELYGNLIYFGSGAEFCRKYWDVKMSEDYFGKHIPDDQYGFSKYIMNLYSRSSDRVYNLRLFGTFGGKDDWRYRFIPNLCAQSVLGLDLIVKQNAVFNFLYINDLLKILERFIETPPESGDYNICDDNKNDIELIELAKIIKKQSSKNKNIIIKEEGLSTKYSGDNSKLKKVFSDITFTSIEESIGNVHSSLLKNLDKLKTSELLIS